MFSCLLLPIHIFGEILSQNVKLKISFWILIRIALNIKINLVRVNLLTIIESSYPEQGINQCL